MKSIKNICFVLLAAVVLTSCEEVIILDLENDEPRLVIEAVVDASTQMATVTLTKSNGFYDDISLDLETGAIVELTLADGSMVTLSEVEDGIYLATGIQVAEGDELTMAITDQAGNLYQATTFVPHDVLIDSLDIVETTGGGPGGGGGSPFGGDTTTQYQIFTFWNDVPNQASYYRLRAIVNDTLQADVYTMIDDVGNDGQQLFRPFFQNFDGGDTVTIQLLSLDKGSYNYFTELSSVQGQGFNSTTPFNPDSNFDNNALGYFGVMKMDTRTVVLE